MAEGFARAITSLGYIEDRVRRALNLVGEVGATFHPELVTPTVVVADATAPGNNLQRGRRFMVTYRNAAAATLLMKWRPLVDVVFTEIVLTYSAISASAPEARLMAPGTADAGAYALAANGAFSEGSRLTVDAAPIEENVAGLGPALGRRIWWAAMTATAPSAVLRDIWVPAGGILGFFNQGVETTTNVNIAARGYTY